MWFGNRSSKCQTAGKPWRQAVGISLRVEHQANLLAVRIIFWVHLETWKKKKKLCSTAERCEYSVHVNVLIMRKTHWIMQKLQQLKKCPNSETKAVQGLIHNLRPWKKECTSLIFCQLWHVLDLFMVFVDRNFLFYTVFWAWILADFVCRIRCCVDGTFVA